MFRECSGCAIATLCTPRGIFYVRNFYAPEIPGVIINCSAYDIYKHIIYMFMLRNPPGYINRIPYLCNRL